MDSRCPRWAEGSGLRSLGCLGPMEVEAAASLQAGGWDGPLMGLSDVHPRAGRRVGGTHRPLSPGQSGSVVCAHRSSVCTCGGPRIPAGGLAASSSGLPDRHPATVCRPRTGQLGQLCLTRSPCSPHGSCCPRDLLAATKMLLYSFLSEQSPETLVKIPSFPFGEGVGTSGQCQPVRLLLWVSGKASVHTHPFLVHTHPSPGLKL